MQFENNLRIVTSIVFRFGNCCGTSESSPVTVVGNRGTSPQRRLN